MSNMHFTTLTDTEDLAPILREIRQYLHQHPELSHKECATAAFVAGKLKEWGWQVTEGIGGYGMVATLRRGEGTKSIMIRADMDALPVQEENNLPYRSEHQGVMHACGHDGHTTMLLGAARQLVRRSQFNGTVYLLFQPAEESGINSGAKRMIDDGLFSRFPCDAIFGAHNHPGVAAGTMMFRQQAAMSSCDTFYITIRGTGGHAARPHQSVDPVVSCSSLVMALQTVVSRNIDPNEMAVVTVGSFHAGNAPNVIPDSARIELSVRAFNLEVRERLIQRIHDLAHYHAQSYAAHAEIEHLPGYPVLINDPQQTDFARKVAEELVGQSRVIAHPPPVTGSEDFAYFLQQRPGCFVRIGNGDSASLHSPVYNFNDDLLTIGAAYWTRLAERFLAG